MSQTKNITIKFGAKAEKQLRKLPVVLRKKLQKQISFLIQDMHYPSLYTKRMQGFVDRWEARIDLHNRFTFIVEDEVITILTVGPHDEGLGKK